MRRHRSSAPLAAAACIFFGSSAAASISDCASVADDADRLRCYDLYAKVVEKLLPAPPVEAEGWQISEKTSPIDDSPVIVATLSAKEVYYGGIGAGVGMLALRCSDGETSVFVFSKSYLSDERVAVTLRLDSLPAQHTMWSRSSDRSSAGLWGGDIAIQFIKRLARGSKLFVRFNANERSDMTFDLSGIDQAASKVGKTCGWADP